MLNHAIFNTLSADLRAVALKQCQVLSLPEGQQVFGAGDACAGLPLVLSGAIKVQMIGASGNGIVLYRMSDNDMCTLSIGCLMTGHGYRAEAIVELAAKVLLVPRLLFERMMAESIAFRHLVLAAYGQRLDDLMLLVEEVAFQRMDQRLAEWLASRPEREILMTHQDIATELGTAREVVSRLLKELEREGKVKLGRGKVELLS